MAATRTQVYLTDEQRARLDAVARRDRRSLAEVIREALDLFLDEVAPDPDAALEEAFGSAPGLEAPSRGEWSRRG
ncbi:MAG: CopG family transcriptional regulator [Solirubrobacterales bacterium]